MLIINIVLALVAALLLFGVIGEKDRAQTAEHHDRLRGRDRAHYRIK